MFNVPSRFASKGAPADDAKKQDIDEKSQP